MTTLEKMKILTDSAQYDLCDYVSHNKSSQINLPGIYEAIGHNGCKIPLFKTLLTNKFYIVHFFPIFLLIHIFNFIFIIYSFEM